MSKTIEDEFGTPERFNEDKADGGVWCEAYDPELDYNYGRFKLTLIDQKSKRCQAFITDYMRRNRLIANQVLSDEQLFQKEVEIFVNLGIVDWDIKNGKGEAIPFSKETATRYFTIPKHFFVFRTCMDEASSRKNFLSDKEEIVKN